MGWIITDEQNRETTVERLIEQYPNLIALDESSFEIDINDFADEPEGLADDGYGNRASRRILFWENADETENDPVAEAVWEDR